jgi:transposase
MSAFGGKDGVIGRRSCG